MLRYFFLVVGLMLLPIGALEAEESQARLCEKPLKAVIEDPLLGKAFKAAYPKIGEAKTLQSGSCIQPYQAILYENSVILLTLTPSEKECRNCSAVMNIVFLKSSKNGSLTRAGEQEAFAHEANFGSLTSVTPMSFGAEEGIVLEGGGSFQGVSFSYLQPYVFREAQAVAFVGDGILLSHKSCGSDGGESCTDLQGQWRADPGGRLLVSYSGKIDGKKIGGTVVYERRGDGLVVSSGNKLAEQINEARP